ncbi:hypothetical protein ACWGJZ_38090, partial [Streptomyces rimosus]
MLGATAPPARAGPAVPGDPYGPGQPVPAERRRCVLRPVGRGGPGRAYGRRRGGVVGAAVELGGGG